MSVVHLLVLDDEPDVGITIALLAEAAGHQARSTVDPAEFLVQHQSWRPTHIVLDLPKPVDLLELNAMIESSCGTRTPRGSR
ncbi:hypothetical protein BH10ACT10_BH10ACT10_11720 [soil metagenome]